MGVQATCTCGARFLANDELVGRIVRCPKCGQNFQVPKPSVPTRPSTLSVACTCGRTFQVPHSWAGRTVQCNSCQQQFVIPQSPAASRRPSPTPQSAPDPLADLGPLGNLGDLSSFETPHAGSQPAATFSSNYGLPAASTSRKIKRRPFNQSKIVPIALGTLAVVAIVGIGIAAFTFFPMLGEYSSPQAVWEKHRNALLNEDWKTIYDCMTPEIQDEMVGGVVVLSQLAAIQDAELATILKKHGLEPKAPPDMSNFGALTGFKKSAKEMKESANAIKDKRGCFVEVMERLSKKGSEMTNQKGNEELTNKIKTDMKEAIGSMTLKDVVIEGDSARGMQTATANGRSIEAPIEFRRINGNWLIHRTSAPGLGSSNSLVP